MALVQRPPGRISQGVAAGELGTDIPGPPPQLAEGPVLGLAERRHRPGQAHEQGIRRISRDTALGADARCAPLTSWTARLAYASVYR